MKNWETFMGLNIGKELAIGINQVLENNHGWMMPKGRFLIATVETEQRTASGIILPDNVEEKPKMGVVIAQRPSDTLADGSDEAYCDYDLNDNFIGDIATIGIYSGKEVYVEGIKEVKELLDKWGMVGKLTFKVISAAEVAFIQPNYN